MKMGQSTLNFLYIEDDKGAIKLMKIYLDMIKSFKSKFDSSYYLKEGLEKLKQQKFDILFLDLFLPDDLESPEENVQLIQEHFPNQSIIVISSYEDNKYASRLIEMGVKDYLFKEEIDAERLERAILFALSRDGKGLDSDAQASHRITDEDDAPPGFAKAPKQAENDHKVVADEEKEDGIIINEGNNDHVIFDEDE